MMYKKQKDNYSVTFELTILTTTDIADNPVIFFPDNEQNRAELSEKDCWVTGNSEKWSRKTLSSCFDINCDNFLHSVTV